MKKRLNQQVFLIKKNMNYTSIFSLFITFFIIISCNNKNQNNTVNLEVKQTVKTTDISQKNTNLKVIKETPNIDTNLIKFINLTSAKVSKKHNQHPDKIIKSILDSSNNVYFYKKKEIIEYYKKPFSWSEEINSNSHPQCMKFINSLESASSIQGIIYLNGGQFIESWTFSSEGEVERILSLYKNCENYSLFEKTMYFITGCSKKIYIFHAQTMGISYNSKRDFEVFEERICK